MSILRSLRGFRDIGKFRGAHINYHFYTDNFNELASLIKNFNTIKNAFLPCTIWSSLTKYLLMLPIRNTVVAVECVHCIARRDNHHCGYVYQFLVHLLQSCGFQNPESDHYENLGEMPRWRNEMAPIKTYCVFRNRL